MFSWLKGKGNVKKKSSMKSSNNNDVDVHDFASPPSSIYNDISLTHPLHVSPNIIKSKEIKQIVVNEYDEVEVYVQGWYLSTHWIREEHNMFTKYTLPVMSTVSDLIKCIETARWSNQFIVEYIFQSPCFTTDISPHITARSPESGVLKFYDWEHIHHDQVLPMVSHWDCYWALDKHGTGMLFRLDKVGLIFENEIPMLRDKPYLYSMRKFITEENKFSHTSILIKGQNFMLSDVVFSLRCPKVSALAK